MIRNQKQFTPGSVEWDFSDGEGSTTPPSPPNCSDTTQVAVVVAMVIMGWWWWWLKIPMEVIKTGNKSNDDIDEAVPWWWWRFIWWSWWIGLFWMIMDYSYDHIGQAPLWEGGQTVLGLEGGGIHMKLVNSKYLLIFRLFPPLMPSSLFPLH